MDNCFIKRADIKVVPYFKTNEDLAKSICWELNSYLKRKDFTGNQPSQGPTFLVFRPSCRAEAEFKDHVTPHLKEGSPQYLIIASSTKPTDTFGISEDDKKRLHCHQTRVVINQGSLVASLENYHDYNYDSLKKLAEAIYKDYSVRFREALNKKKPETKGFIDRLFSRKESDVQNSEEMEQKKQGQSPIKIKWLSTVGQSVTDVEMASHVPESSSSVQTMARNTAFREALNKKKPETKGLIDRFFFWKESHVQNSEEMEQKKQGQSPIKIKWLSIVGQSVTDVEMASHVPESSSSVQTMARNTAAQVKAQEVGQRDQGHEPTMQEAQQDDFVFLPDGTEDEIVWIRATTVACRFCGSSIHDDSEVIQCPGCHTKQKRMKSEWMYSLHFQKDLQRLYSVSSDVMMKCLEGRGVKENEIENFLLTCGKIRYKTYNENDMAIGNEG